MIKLKDLDQSHDWDTDGDVGPDPHSSGYRCRACKILICKFCSDAENDEYEEAVRPCPRIAWYEVDAEASKT